MLQIKDLTFRIAGRPLLEGANVSIPAGHRVGFVGPNGAGKSTLLKLIGGELQADSGDLTVRPRARIGYLRQEAPEGPTTALEAVIAADTERAELFEEAETSTDGMRIAEIHERLNAIEAHSAPARAAQLLAGLGFDEAAQNRPLSEFSGGWRMRVAIAGLLLIEPDLLLLDEPTNHLDMEAALWLEGHLANYPRTMLIVSHDRDFLNRAVNHILHLDQRKLVLYRGGYDVFERQRRDNLIRQSKMAERDADQRKHLQAFIDRFKAKASKARQAQSRVKALAKLQPIAAAVEDRSISFNFPEPEELAPPLITFDDVAVSYTPGKPILKHISLRIDPDDRIALLGANGNGKTTFARLLAGRLNQEAGALRRANKVRFGYFAQHQLEELDGNATAYVQMRRLMPDAAEAKVRARLGAFGFSRDKADVMVNSLSGGEKARLVFALITYDAPQVLILDEPTNHLDIDSREALVQALNDYTGAVILVSHDRHIIETCVDRFLLVADGTVRAFDGDLEDYATLLNEQRRREQGGGGRENKGDKRKDKRNEANERNALTPIRKKLKSVEADIAKTNESIEKAEKHLADPAIYEGPDGGVVKAGELNRRLADLRRKLETLEENWIELNEKLEAAQ